MVFERLCVENDYDMKHTYLAEYEDEDLSFSIRHAFLPTAHKIVK